MLSQFILKKIKTKKKSFKGLSTIVLFASVLTLSQSHSNFSNEQSQHWMKIRATDKFERSVIANIGVAIEGQAEDYVIAYGNDYELQKVKALGWLVASSPMINAQDFPSKDGEFHNYTELTNVLQELTVKNADIMAMDSIGKSLEGRDIWHIRISTDLGKSHEKPAVVFMGGHHAREHLSIDVPLRIAQNLIHEFRSNNPRVVAMLQGREIHFIPCVNPDGAEFDIANANYKMWRKNRAANGDGTYGVDLNRNYGFKWGTGGSSKKTNSDTYMGPQPFSEPETRAIRDFLLKQQNINILLSYHTYSELILYPWGHSYDPISDSRGKQVHEIMAQKMATWNGYTPQQASSLYIASGDTMDWAYGSEKIISFTFELDPKDGMGGWGFYPGAKVIPEVVRKNTEPAMYLIEHADNPYRVINEKNGASESKF